MSDPVGACACVGPQNGEPFCPCRMKREAAKQQGQWALSQLQKPSPFKSYVGAPPEPRKTLRDEFAMAALIGLLASPSNRFFPGGPATAANDAYRAADFMLAARQAKGE